MRMPARQKDESSVDPGATRLTPPKIDCPARSSFRKLKRWTLVALVFVLVAKGLSGMVNRQISIGSYTLHVEIGIARPAVTIPQGLSYYNYSYKVPMRSGYLRISDFISGFTVAQVH